MKLNSQIFQRESFNIRLKYYKESDLSYTKFYFYRDTDAEGSLL